MRFLYALLALSTLAAFEDAPAPKPVVEWLGEAKKHAPAAKDLLATKSGDSAARVVIVGRAFSATVELAQFEGSIVANANESDVIALDIGARESDEIDRWLRSGAGQIDEIIAAAGAFGWSRVEARAWLDELKRREQKPKIAGIATGDPKRACAEVVAFLGKVDPSAHPRAERALRPLCVDGRNGEPLYTQLDDNERAILRMGIEETLSLVRDGEEAYTQKSSAAEYAHNLRLVVELNQYVEVMRFEREGGERDPRGRIMAENVLSLLKAGPADARLFALVGLRDLGRASDPDSLSAQLVALGGPRAFCIGTACGAATFRALDPSAAGSRVPRDLKITSDEAGAFERALAAASGGASWILDLRTKPSDASVTTWLTAHRSLRSARAVCGGARETPWDHDILSDFDAVAWFPSGTASKVAR